MAEIDALNAKMAPFKIFKGIESDILNDGRLDYEEDLMKQFDFIIASVHTICVWMKKRQQPVYLKQ